MPAQRLEAEEATDKAEEEVNIETQIAALLAEAEPLRCLDEGDEAKKPLAGIVDRINQLRFQQALMPQKSGADEWFAAEIQMLSIPEKRGPGRPRKAA